MNNPGFQTVQYPYPYQSGKKPPTNEVGAVNITINGVNPPSPYGQYSPYGVRPMPVYYPVYYPGYPPQYYCSSPASNLMARKGPEEPIPSQGLHKDEAPKPEQEKKPEEKEEKEPKKDLTPLTDQLINGLNGSLTQGDKQARIHAIARVLGLLREDPENRRNNPKLIGLINTALHSSQPSEVREAATIACDNGLVSGNDTTRAYLNEIAGKKDRYGLNTLAASALYKMPGQANAQTSPAGQKLNVVSQ